jgi:hypothetical protein
MPFRARNVPQSLVPPSPWRQVESQNHIWISEQSMSSWYIRDDVRLDDLLPKTATPARPAVSKIVKSGLDKGDAPAAKRVFRRGNSVGDWHELAFTHFRHLR